MDVSQVFKMANNSIMIVENGITRIVKDNALLSKTNEEIIQILNERRNRDEEHK